MANRVADDLGESKPAMIATIAAARLWPLASAMRIPICCRWARRNRNSRRRAGRGGIMNTPAHFRPPGGEPGNINRFCNRPATIISDASRRRGPRPCRRAAAIRRFVHPPADSNVRSAGRSIAGRDDTIIRPLQRRANGESVSFSIIATACSQPASGEMEWGLPSSSPPRLLPPARRRLGRLP